MSVYVWVGVVVVCRCGCSVLYAHCACVCVWQIFDNGHPLFTGMDQHAIAAQIHKLSVCAGGLGRWGWGVLKVCFHVHG